VYEQIASNRRRTWLLIVGAVLLLGAVGYALGTIWATGPVGLVVATVIALVMSVASYRFGDRVVLASARAKEVTPQEQPRLHNIVEGLSIAAGIPKPRVYLVPEAAPNAFATGRDPEHASIAVTEGLLQSLNRVELEGVVGHELAHVVDRDILVGTVVATLAGAVILLSEFFMRSWLWGGFRGRRGGDRGGGGAEAIIFAVGLVLLVLAPIFAQVIRFSVSRQREYLADATAAQYLGEGKPLADALGTLQRGVEAVPMNVNPATETLYIVNPLSGRGVSALFSTHPPMEERIRRLHALDAASGIHY
jgi:heat shock protein HtpX